MLSERHEGRHPLTQPRLVRLIGLGFLVLSASAWLSASARSATADPPNRDSTPDEAGAQSGERLGAEDGATASLGDMLAQAREQLADYYSQIESIRLVYTTERTPSPGFAERARESTERLKRQFDIAERSERFDLLLTPVGQRLITTEKTVLTDGSTRERVFYRYQRDGRRTDVTPDTSQAFITTPRDGLTVRHPLHGLGWAIPGSEELRLTDLLDLLDLPDVTRIEQEAEIEGQPALVLTIGPGIPEAKRVLGWNADSRIKVWLAKELHYLPLRMEIHYRADQPPYVTACRRFAAATTASGQPSVVFPREVEFSDRGGTTAFTIEEVTLRPIVQESDLTPEIPPSFHVTRDGAEQGRIAAEPRPPRDLEVQVLDVHERPVRGARVTLWARGSTITAIQAARDGKTNDPQPLKDAVTDEQGKVLLELVPGEDLSLWTDHPQLREARWIIGAVDAHRTYLLPRTKVTVRDEQGNPLEGVELSTEASPSPTGMQLRSYDYRGKDVTDASGMAMLTSEYTVRRPDQPVRIVALDDQGRAAIVARPAKLLEEALELTLRPVRVVQAAIQLDFQGPDALPIHWADQQGNVLVGYSAERDTESGTYSVKFPLPPGNYQMIIKPTDQTDELVVPVEVPAGTGEFELGSYSLQASQTKLLEGQPAPELAVSWDPGNETQLANLRGKVVVLDFWGYWCGPCLEMMPLLMNLADEFTDEPVVWLAIHDASLANISELDEHVTRLEKRWQREFNLTVALDQPNEQQQAHGGVTCSRYGVRSWPTTIVIDQSGRVVGSVRKDKIEPTIRRLLGK